jgi:transcriptional antiterminator RfaH
LNRWALIRTQPRAERKAVFNAERQGYRCFLPKLHVEKYVRGKKLVADEPMFSSYVFVYIVQQWHSLLGTFGVINVITGPEGNPIWVPHAVVADLQARCDSNQVFVRERFKAGQTVLVERGALANASCLVTAIYQGMNGRERADILIQMLGTWTRATVCERDLAAA